MSSTIRMRTALLLAAAASVASCTSSPSIGGNDPLQTLPSESVGAILVGPSQFPFDSDIDTISLIPFDKDGHSLGTLNGGAVLNGQIQISGQNIVVPTARSLIELGSDGRSDTDISEQVVEAVIKSNETDDGIIWFNSGNVNNVYSTNFWLTHPDNPVPISGTLPGMAVSSTFCGSTAYAVLEDQSQLSWDGPLSNSLYRIESDGSTEIVGEWKFPASKRPVSRQAVCSDDTRSMSVLYTDREGSDNPDLSPLLKVQFDLSTSSVTEHELLTPGEGWRVPTKAVSSANGRIYWANIAGQVYSTSIQGTEPAHLEFEVETKGLGDRIVINGQYVHVLSDMDGPTLSSYDLESGNQSTAEIRLPWLSSIVGSETESGQSTNIVADLAVF